MRRLTKVRVFKNKPFARFAKKAALSDDALMKAVKDVERGVIDADLGGGVIEQRVARPGGGKSGSFRTIILFRIRDRAFFVHGFAKNEKENISDKELEGFKVLAHALFAYDDAAISKALEYGILLEITR
jgi:hypothetical protein